MSMSQPEVAARDQYLAEANAELDAMLGEVGELDATPAPEPAPGRSWVQLVVIAVIAVAVFTLGVLLLRGRRPRGMALHLMR
jgi:hypothetical protein